MENPSIEDLERASAQLRRSEKGQQAMRNLLAFLDAGRISLDANNQQACRVLLAGAWGRFAGTAREVMRAEAMSDAAA